MVLLMIALLKATVDVVLASALLVIPISFFLAWLSLKEPPAWGRWLRPGRIEDQLPSLVQFSVRGTSAQSTATTVSAASMTFITLSNHSKVVSNTVAVVAEGLQRPAVTGTTARPQVAQA